MNSTEKPTGALDTDRWHERGENFCNFYGPARCIVMDIRHCCVGSITRPE